MIVTKHGMTSIGMEMDRVMIQRNDDDINSSGLPTELDDISVSFSGKYSLAITKDCLELMKRSQLNEYAKNAGVYHKNGRYGSGKKHHGPSYITNVDACLFGCEDCFGNEVAEQNINDVCC